VIENCTTICNIGFVNYIGTICFSRRCAGIALCGARLPKKVCRLGTVGGCHVSQLFSEEFRSSLRRLVAALSPTIASVGELNRLHGVIRWTKVLSMVTQYISHSLVTPQREAIDGICSPTPRFTSFEQHPQPNPTPENTFSFCHSEMSFELKP
jgi:hypothetical protein